MSVNKRISGDYNLTTLDTNANVTLTTHTVYVNGNLFVGGTSTSVNKVDMEITDNMITLNKGEVGAGVSLGTAGLAVDRGSLPTVDFRWNEDIDLWQVTSDGVNYANVLSSSGAGTVNIVDDTSPQLGGALDVNGKSIFNAVSDTVIFDSNVALPITTVNPTTVSNYNTLYYKTPSTAGSGVYVTQSNPTGQELTTLNKTLLFSLLL